MEKNTNVIIYKAKICLSKSNSINDGRNYLVITQDALIRKIAKDEDIHIATVRQIFKSAEDNIFDYLSSTPTSDNVEIKLLKGISLKRKYVKSKKYSKGMFQNIDCDEHVGLKGNISKYYTEKINKVLF